METSELKQALSKRVKQSDETAEQLRGRLDKLNYAYAHAADELASALRTFSVTQITSIAEGASSADEDIADKIRRLQRQRAERRDEAQATLIRCQREASVAESALANAEQHFDSLKVALAKCESEAECALQQWPDAKSIHDAVLHATETALQAERKATAASNEAEQKVQAYRQDPLFAYLYRRRFGTATYNASPVVRWIDAWVASVCGFTHALRDFELLHSLPTYLHEHATLMHGKADGVRAEFTMLRKRAQREHGCIEATAAQDEARAAALVAVDASREHDRALRDAQRAVDDVDAWADPISKELIAFATTAFETESCEALLARARETTSAHDDRAVEVIARVRTRMDELKEKILTADRDYDGAQRVVTQLKTLKSELKGRSWMSDRYEVDEDRASAVLDRASRSTLDVALAVTTIASLAREKPRSSYSDSGDHSYRSRDSSSSFSFGGDSHSSGGSFGGGSFQTGGGF